VGFAPNGLDDGRFKRLAKFIRISISFHRLRSPFPSGFHSARGGASGVKDSRKISLLPPARSGRGLESKPTEAAARTTSGCDRLQNRRRDVRLREGSSLGLHSP
jgi:hypothetical protein